MLYHIGFSKADFAGKKVESVILVGDPDRAQYIAENFFKSQHLLSKKRGLHSYLVQNDQSPPVLISTSGMGGPSTSIVINELAQLEIKRIIRIGTCGSIQDHVKVADLVISQASLSEHGAADDIAPEGYPASADPYLTVGLMDQAKLQKMKVHLGITASVDTFYEGQERTATSANPYLLRRLHQKTEEYRNLGVLNYEMESATLFKQALVYRIAAACVCAVIAERESSEEVAIDKKKKAEDSAIQLVVDYLTRALHVNPNANSGLSS